MKRVSYYLKECNIVQSWHAYGENVIEESSRELNCPWKD